MRIRQFITAALCGLSLTTTSASHAAKDKVTVLLDWFINPDHAPNPLAFCEEGESIENNIQSLKSKSLKNHIE